MPQTPEPASLVRVARTSAAYVFGMAVSNLIGLALLPVMTRYLPPEQLGIVTLATRVGEPLGIVVQLGLLGALQMQYFKFASLQRAGLLRTLFCGQILASAVVCILLSVLGAALARRLLPNLPLTDSYLYGLWLMVVWQGLFSGVRDLGNGLFQLREQPGIVVGFSLFSQTLGAVLAILVVVGFGWQGLGRYGAYFMTSVVSAACILWLVAPHCRGAFDRGLLGKMLGKGLMFVPHNLSSSLVFAINAWMLGDSVSVSSLAIFGVALLFTAPLEMPLNALCRAAYPSLAQLMSSPNSESRARQARLYTLLAISTVAVSLGALLFGPLAIRLLSAAPYHNATMVVPTLVLAWLFQGFYLMVYQPVLFFAGGGGLSIATLAALASGATLAVSLIPAHGIQGASWALVGSFAVKFIVAAAISRRLYKVPWEYRKIAGAVGCGLVLAILDHLVPAPLSRTLAVGSKIALFLALAPALWLTGVVTTGECSRIRHLLVDRLKSFRCGAVK